MSLTFNPFTGTFDFTGGSGGGGTIAGTIDTGQVAVGVALDTIGGSASLTASASAIAHVGSANTLTISGAATGHPVSLVTTGSDSDIHLWLKPKNDINNNARGSVVIAQTDPSTWGAVVSSFIFQNDLVIASEQSSGPTVFAAANNGIFPQYAVSDGTLASPTVFSAGSGFPIAATTYTAFSDDGAYRLGASIDIDVAAAVPNGDHGWPARILFRTVGSSGSNPPTRLRIDSDLGVFVDSGGLTLANGLALKTDTTTAHTALLQAYDVDGAAYSTFAMLTNGNTPTFVVTPPSGGTVTLNATTLQQGGNSITLGGALTTSGAFALTLTQTGATNVTLPTSGTLLTTTGSGAALTFPGTLSIASGKVLTASNTLTFTGTDSTSFAFPSTSDTVVALTATQTLTNKRITKRVTTASDATSITPNSDTADVTYQANTQAAGTLTINADAGTPTNGQSWVLKIKSTNVQTFSWNSIYVGGTVALPTATTGGVKIDYFVFMYDSVTPKWDYTGTAGGF